MSVFGKFFICIFTLFSWGFAVTRNSGLESSWGGGVYAVLRRNCLGLRRNA